MTSHDRRRISSSTTLEIRIETFLSGRYGRDNPSPGARGRGPVHFEAGVRFSGGLHRRRVDIPAIAPLFLDIGRVQVGTRSRGRPVAVATVRGHFLVPERFTPA